MPVLSVGLGFGDLLPDLPFAEAVVLPPGASSGHLVPAAYGLLHMDAVMAEKATKAAQKAEKAAQPKRPRGRQRLTAQVGPKRGRGRPKKYGPPESGPGLKAKLAGERRLRRQKLDEKLSEPEKLARKAKHAGYRRGQRQEFDEKLSEPEKLARKAIQAEQKAMLRRLKKCSEQANEPQVEVGPTRGRKTKYGPLRQSLVTESAQRVFM